MKNKQKDVWLKELMTKHDLKKHQLVTDYFKCKNKYKISYEDYFNMHFYELDASKRSELLTPLENSKLINQLNPFEERYLIVSKNEFNHRFDSFIKRDWLLLDESNNEEFRLFIKSRDYIFVPALDKHKPTILDISRENEWQLHQELINTHHYIIEEVVKHHSVFDDITNQSLVTIKFITLFYNDTVHILGCYLDIEIKEDKFYIPVDLKTGKTFGQAIHNYNTVDYINNYKVKSFKLPHFKKALKTVNQLPLITPKLKYISWEFALSADDVILISASDEPDSYILQQPFYLEKNEGLLKKINTILGGKDL